MKIDQEYLDIRKEKFDLIELEDRLLEVIDVSQKRKILTFFLKLYLKWVNKQIWKLNKKQSKYYQ